MKVDRRQLFFICCVAFLEKVVHATTEETTKQENVTDPVSEFERYKKLFALQRKEHQLAVRNVLEIDSFEKQYKMVDIVLRKLFAVLQESRVVIMEAGFTPGDPFPGDKKTRDVFSVILENTAIFGDVLLRLPRITHTLFDKNKDWQLLAKWGIGFCNDTGVFDDGTNAKLLYLMGQELNLLERDPNYVNPFKADDELDKIIEEELRREKMQQELKKTKKMSKKKKGPRLSRGEL